MPIFVFAIDFLQALLYNVWVNKYFKEIYYVSFC